MEANTPPADARPLTFADLREMAVRYVNNAEIKLLVDEAIKTAAVWGAQRGPIGSHARLRHTDNSFD